MGGFAPGTLAAFQPTFAPIAAIIKEASAQRRQELSGESTTSPTSGPVASAPASGPVAPTPAPASVTPTKTGPTKSSAPSIKQGASASEDTVATGLQGSKRRKGRRGGSSLLSLNSKGSSGPTSLLGDD